VLIAGGPPGWSPWVKSSPSSVLKSGLINHRDGVATYVPRAAARGFTPTRVKDASCSRRMLSLILLGL